MKELKVSNYHVFEGVKKKQSGDEVLNSEDFKSLIPILSPTDLSTIEHVGGSSLNLTMEHEPLFKALITSNEFATLDKKSRLFFTKGKSENGTSRSVTVIFEKEYGGQKMLEIYEKNNEDDELKFVSLLSLTGEVKEKYEKGVIASEETFKEGTITTQGMLDGCMPGGYFWCGKACGYQTGATAIKNKIDGCCLNHDFCYTKYKTFSERCANCDKELVRCVQHPVNRIQDPATADKIKIAFNGLCKFS